MLHYPWFVLITKNINPGIIVSLLLLRSLSSFLRLSFHQCLQIALLNNTLPIVLMNIYRSNNRPLFQLPINF